MQKNSKTLYNKKFKISVYIETKENVQNMTYIYKYQVFNHIKSIKHALNCLILQEKTPVVQKVCQTHTWQFILSLAIVLACPTHFFFFSSLDMSVDVFLSIMDLHHICIAIIFWVILIELRAQQYLILTLLRQRVRGQDGIFIHTSNLVPPLPPRSMTQWMRFRLKRKTSLWLFTHS